jgi:hypothetical protein
MSDEREELVAEVNRLYWETDIPVTRMAEELGISRRTIYDMLIPSPAGENCPECGGDLVYPNRSARLSGEATCERCGRTQDVTLLHEISAARGTAREEAVPAAPAPPVSTRVAPRVRRAVAERPLGRVAEFVEAHRPAPALIVLFLSGALIAAVATLLVPGRRRRRRR